MKLKKSVAVATFVRVMMLKKLNSDLENSYSNPSSLPKAGSYKHQKEPKRAEKTPKRYRKGP